jgi:penicillin-binding protein 1A
VPHYVIRIATRAGLVALFAAAAVLGTVSGVLFAYAGDLPQISALDDYAPSTITRVYASGGQVIGEFATKRRVVIGYDDIPPQLREAIISAEDHGFNRHFGVSLSRILITAAQDVINRRMAGASTLTQQLARDLFLTQEKTLERKVKEAILALQIERRYTKREILTLYCNQIYFGHGAYGVEAASRLYFGKRARDLSLEESALIAGIIQTPERQSPLVDMRRALRRRNYVLQQMAEEGYITRAQAEAAEQKPIVLSGQPTEDESIAPYFVEEVRKYLERKYGAKRLYENGLAVGTSLDVDLQQASARALEVGLRRLDKRHGGFRRPARNVLNEKQSLEGFTDPRWSRPIKVDEIVPALIMAVVVDKASAARAAAALPDHRSPAYGSALVRVGRHLALLKRDGFAWTRRASAAELFKPGDLIEVRVTKLGQQTGQAEVALEQEPEVGGAVLAIENRTGQIKALVGGLDFSRSQWNRATQADRQMGSAFKPIVYTAAIDRGFTPATILQDTPVSYPAGPGQPLYAPHDYDGKFEGPITLRRAVEQSRNVPAVRVMDQLGPKQVIQYARRFGLEGRMDPYLSLALGSASASLLEVTSAYSVFPNQGVLMRPYEILSVQDRDGNLLEENRPEPRDAIRADTAFILTNLLRGVVARGTAAASAALAWPLAGKTGTTNDFTDAWFIGFDPDITIGVWVGYNDKKPLGPAETGAQAALPIWMDVMRAHIAKHGNPQNPPAFEPPGNIVFVTVDRATGTPVTSESPGSITEAFIAGTEPGSSLGK